MMCLICRRDLKTRAELEDHLQEDHDLTTEEVEELLYGKEKP